MLQKLASTTFVLGSLVIASMPAVGLAQSHGSRSGGNRSFSRESGGAYHGRSFAGSGRSYVPHADSGGYSRGQSYYGGYVAPRSYARPVYRRYYGGGGVYLNFGVPYGYAYAPGYAYGPSYAPGYGYDPSYSYGSERQQCTDGSYDQNGAWVPSPNCYRTQQYPPPQQNYDPNQQQYPPAQQYDPNQQQYPPAGQYNSNQQQYPQPLPNYDPNQPQP